LETSLKALNGAMTALEQEKATLNTSPVDPVITQLLQQNAAMMELMQAQAGLTREMPKWLGSQDPAPTLKVGLDQKPTREAVMTWCTLATAWLKENHVVKRMSKDPTTAPREINKALTKTWMATKYWSELAPKAGGEDILALSPTQLIAHFRARYVRPNDVIAAHVKWWTLRQGDREAVGTFFGRVQDMMHELAVLGSPRTDANILELLGMGGNHRFARLLDDHPQRPGEPPSALMTRLDDVERTLKDPTQPVNAPHTPMEVDFVSGKTVCRQFALGKCKWGEQCYNLHAQQKPDTQQTPRNGRSSRSDDWRRGKSVEGRSRTQVECHRCGGLGHFARECTGTIATGKKLPPTVANAMCDGTGDYSSPQQGGGDAPSRGEGSG
jgi:hypothetical protein